MSLKSYNFKEVIGRGSYGEVWLANDSSEKKCVVKKISLRNATEKEKAAARSECSLLKQLNHPNIVLYKESFEVDGFIYIAMAYCEGGTLYTKIKERSGKHLSEKQITEWFIQIVMALSYMHERNILHRDLKTENIFLAKNSVIKVGDLGIAKQLQNKNDMAVTTIGTPYYMSPELFKKMPYNFKSDIWSLGCITYEMVTLKHAFNAKNFSALSSKIIMGHVPSMPTMYTKELKSLVESMLSNKPENRPSTNKILSNPYIRQHIKHFLESARNGRENSSSSKAVPIIHKSKTSVDEKSRSIGSSPSKNSPGKSHNKVLLDNKHKKSSDSTDKSREDDDNSDVVCHHVKNSHSRKSSISENHSPLKSSLTVLEKEIEKADIKNDIKKQAEGNVASVLDKKHCESTPQIYKKNSLVDVENGNKKVNDRMSARDRRRQSNRNRGLGTLFFEPDDDIEGINKEDRSETNSDESVDNKKVHKHRRRYSSGQDLNIILPELKRRSDDEGLRDEPDMKINEVIQVCAKMNETLSIGYNPKLMAVQDSLLCQVNCYDDPTFGPKEDDEETLGRTNLNKLRYPEIRKETIKNIGWEKVYEAYRILDDMNLDHEDHLKRLLGENYYHKYAWKIFWLKMVEAA